MVAQKIRLFAGFDPLATTVRLKFLPIEMTASARPQDIRSVGDAPR